MELMIDAGHCGPPESGNGGWTSGTLAASVRTTPDLPAVRVRLHSPPPLDRPMTVSAEDGSQVLRDGTLVVATAWPAARPVAEGLEMVGLAAAAEAEARYEGLAEHPFATCFTCGTARSPQDALCLRPGPLEDGTGRYAARWTPYAAEPALVWAALDCPGGWSAGITGRPMVLGEMTCVIDALPQFGAEHIVVARQTGGAGRKHFSASALYTSGGQLLAIATATWIAVDPASVRPGEPGQNQTAAQEQR